MCVGLECAARWRLLMHAFYASFVLMLSMQFLKAMVVAARKQARDSDKQ
jgi:hypothetical protein